MNFRKSTPIPPPTPPENLKRKEILQGPFHHSRSIPTRRESDFYPPGPSDIIAQNRRASIPIKTVTRQRIERMRSKSTAEMIEEVIASGTSFGDFPQLAIDQVVKNSILNLSVQKSYTLIVTPEQIGVLEGDVYWASILLNQEPLFEYARDSDDETIILYVKGVTTSNANIQLYLFTRDRGDFDTFLKQTKRIYVCQRMQSEHLSNALSLKDRWGSGRKTRSKTSILAPPKPLKADKLLFRYPFDEKKYSVQVHYKDRSSLDSGTFLNDVIIEFYLKYLTQQNPGCLERTYIFSSFLYEQFTSGMSNKGSYHTRLEAGYERVKTWTKVDIFKKEFLIMPINERLHWYLAIIHNPGALLQSQETQVQPMDVDEDDKDELLEDEPVLFDPKRRKLEEGKCRIFILDSLGIARKAAVRHIKSFLVLELYEKRNRIVDATDIHGVKAHVPLQPNHCDCGVYLLLYSERLLTDPDKYLNLLVDRSKRRSSDSSGWDTQDISKKRGEIRRLIDQLSKKYREQYSVEATPISVDDDDDDVVIINDL